MILLKYISISLLIFTILFDDAKDKTIFRPPMKIPILLSANFGETRIDHFHSGIDIKTQGAIGKEVVAAAEGHVYRISVSPGGFGKALYIKHPSGYSTVYAHLDRFTPEIEEYVKTMQYERKSFLIALFPSSDKFPVKQGEIIGYSGNSGSSFGPHLHFEIRKTENEIPVNPLLFNIGHSDNLPPIIEKLAIYPLTKNSYINNNQSVLRINTRGGHGRYKIPEEKEIIVSGSIGFGLKLHDLLNGSHNKCEPYSIELKIDSITVFRYLMDQFPFHESRYVNGYIDYEAFMRERTYFAKAFVLPNNKLGNYKELVNRGIVNFFDNAIHDVQFIVSDANNNISTLSFQVRSKPEKMIRLSLPEERDLKIMPHNRTNRFHTDDFSAIIPSGALYDTLKFSYRKSPGTPVMLSALHSVHNKYTPVQKPITLSIKPDSIPMGKESKMMIVELSDNMSKKAIKSKWTDGYLTADVLAFGDYFVGMDTLSPAITAHGLCQGENITGKKELKIKIIDDFSGIKSYEPVIDGKWALFEYDAKNNILIYSFDDKRITRGSKHNLSLRVYDNMDNESYYSCDFTW